MITRSRLLASAALSSVAMLVGCSASGDVEGVTTVSGVPKIELRALAGAGDAAQAATYAQAFDVARNVLRDMGFMLERVDAQAGVIATQQKGSGGIATPWDKEQSTAAQEIEDAIERNKRTVRIDFVPAGQGAPTGAGSLDDLRKFTGPIDMHVSVDKYRWQLSGWRLNTQAILYSTYTVDTEAAGRNAIYYGVAIDKDEQLARRIIQGIRERLATHGG